MGSKSDENFKAKLIANVKKEVKQVMEESVTRKFVHEESGSVTALCGAVEACLSQGLRRRALGLFKTSSTTALLHKIAKHSPEAAIISKKLQQIENSDPNRRSSSSSDSLTKPTLKKNASFHGLATTQPKHLWIRLALFERNLPKVIDFLVQNASKYYERDSLVADADYGSILSSLLVGPCALDYSKTRNQSFWSDPPADELVQRHRISSSASTPPSVRRPILNFKRSLNASSEDSGGLRGSSQLFAKDYVESLHQNAKESLIFGKNNVLISPQKAGNSNLIPGYLSLHQNVDGLTLKWTPNQLINGFKDDEECLKNVNDKSVYWDYALTVRLDEIVYVHCHRENDTGGTIILVGQDGVQRPPIHFPKGGHMLAFLSCVETGLLPRGRLDPPLWSQRNNNNKKRRPLATLGEKNEENDGDETFLVKKKEDLVFRIIDHREIGLKRNQLMDTHVQFPSSKSIKTNSSTSSESSTKSLSIDQSVININNITVQDGYSPPSIQAVCDSMKRQIISRAFYGWLAYCRHLSTVRRHLTGLVNSKIINDEVGAKDGVTIEKWREICNEGVITDRGELYKLVYFGGIHHDLRKEIWPYLLGHYKFGSNIDERVKLSEETKQAYENTMSEWLAVEAIVRQRDKESQANAIAKLSSDSISGNEVPKQIQRDLSNDVFEDFSSFSDEDDPKIITHPQNDDENDVLSKENVTQHDLDCLKKERLLKEYSTTSSTKAQISEFSSIDTEYSSKETESSEVTEIQDMEKCLNVNEGKFVTPEMTTEDFDVNNVIVTTASVDLNQPEVSVKTFESLTAVKEENSLDTLDCIDSHGLVSPSVSACVSPASSNGGVYTQELLESFGQNLHRIDKDVQRCDRNYWYFTNENLEKLRNVMCTYVWEHLEIGYMQGMCDLVAPLLVIFNDESLTYACFCRLMERMVENFPSGNAMDCHFANMRSLIQILDAEIYELMQSHGDYTHFYFCYRWFLLDFKREMVYDDVYATWETIWAAREVASGQFVLFLALALLETYRDIILSNGMDFTDIIKFFNEMAERHDASAVLRLARDLVLQLQLLIENK